MAKRNNKLPAETKADRIYSFAKAGLSAIPVVGGPAAELLDDVITPPLSKRRDEWLQSISDGLSALEEKMEGFSIESLSRNEQFITMFMETTLIAIRNHSKQKIEALRNALLNSALKNPDELLQTMLLHFLEEATPWHLRVLSFYQNPESYTEKAGIKLQTGDFLREYVSDIFPELKGKDAFRLQVERDLLHQGLIYPEGEWYSSRTTDTGDRVLALIASPLPETSPSS